MLEFFDGGARANISQREGEAGELIVEGEVMALDRECMGSAVEAVMRRISEAAALLDAVLEIKVVRGADPKSADEEAVAEMHRELSEAGFPVRMDVLWRPPSGGDVWVGCCGEDGEYAESFRNFIEARSAWRVV